MNNLFCLDRYAAEQRFDEMMPMLRKLIAQFPEGTYTLGGIMGKFSRGEWTCWIITEAPEPTSPIQAVIGACVYPGMDNRPVLQIMFVTGRNPDMLVDTLDEFHAMAYRNGIRKIEIIGRPGWTPWLKTLGYDTSLRLYRHTLDDTLANVQTEGNA